MRKIGTISLSVLYALFLLGSIHHGTAFASAASKSAPKPPAVRMAALSALPPIEKGALFLGDSITAVQDLSDLLGMPVHNRGVSAITTGGVLDHLDTLLKGTPDRVFILLGINDIMFSVGRHHFTENYRSIIEKVRQLLPGSRIFAISIMPTNNAVFNTSVLVYNEVIKDIAARARITYIDVHSRMLKGASVDPEYVTDGIHLSRAGYILWKNVLDRYFLDDPPQ